jgi:hypothetical protein
LKVNDLWVFKVLFLNAILIPVCPPHNLIK